VLVNDFATEILFFWIILIGAFWFFNCAIGSTICV
jgi:hypothetical protein